MTDKQRIQELVAQFWKTYREIMETLTDDEVIMVDKNVKQNARVWIATEVEGTGGDAPAHELVRRIVRHRWDADWLYETLHRLVARHPVDDVTLREMLREDDHA